MTTDAPTRAAGRRATRRRRLARLATLGAIVGVVLGVGTITTLTVFPEQSEQLYGAVQRDVGQFRNDVLHELPAVELGASGGTSELDRCDHTFTEMLSYETDGVPPVWAAHNNCGGDVVLPWEIGQQVEVAHDGTTELYVVVDIRVTPKTWATTDDLIGITGDFALQSCFYGENRMRFVGLARAADAAA